MGSPGWKVVTVILHEQKKQHTSMSLWRDLTRGVPENSKAHQDLHLHFHHGLGSGICSMSLLGLLSLV